MTSIDCDAITLKDVSQVRSRSNSVGRTLYLFVVLLLSASVVLNVLLAHRLSLLKPRQTNQRFAGLRAGMAVPPIKAKTANGQSATIIYSNTDRPTVLYIFTPGCIWCARNMENIKALIAARDAQDRFVGLSLSEEGLNKYLSIYPLSMPVFVGLSSESLEAYQLGATPQTIVVSPAGRVLQSWSGAWNDKLRPQVEAYFQVKLPGLDNTASLPDLGQGHL